MVIYGLIGYPLTHSWSGAWFAEKLRKAGKPGYRYLDFPLPTLEEFPPLFRKYPGLVGLNVTIPYKEQIIPFLEILDPKAEKIGAVNTILISHEKGNIHLIGFNTDADGFSNSADFSGHRNALILGTGGASKAVAFALAELGISYLFVSRSKKSAAKISYEDLSEDVISSHTLIVNTTPLGMFPSIETCPPIPYQFLTEQHFLYDLVYNPQMTLFLKMGLTAKANVQNGLKMFELQAEMSYAIWNR
jgi:shikimate dehydrogenase